MATSRYKVVNNGGTLAFANSAQQTWSGNALSAINYVQGTHTFRIGTNNAALTSSQLAKITISTSAAGLDANGYLFPTNLYSNGEAWRMTHFGSSSNSGQTADGADPDQDGMTNLLERALGSSPRVNSISALPSSGTNADFLTLTFNRASATTDLTYRVEASDDLNGTWLQIYSSSGVVNPYQVTVTDTQVMTNRARRFLRLKITAP